LGTKYRYILPQHVNYFTASTLARLAVGEGGFQIVETGTMHFNPLVIWQDWRSKGGEVSDQERARLLQRTTRYKQTAALKPVKWALAGIEAGLRRLSLADNLFLVLRKSA
jgi:hypothetical protein